MGGRARVPVGVATGRRRGRVLGGIRVGGEVDLGHRCGLGHCRDRGGGRGLALDRDVDVVQLGTLRRRLDLATATESREVLLERAADAVAIAGDVLLERVGVGAQLLTSCRQVEQLGLEPAAFALGDPSGGGFGVADQRLRLGLRLLEHLLGTGLRLVHRVVGGALREQQCALQHLGVVTTRRERHLGRRRGGDRSSRRRGGTARGRLQILREALDGDRGALEQIVDLVAVVPAPRVLDLTAAEFLGGHIHGRSW